MEKIEPFLENPTPDFDGLVRVFKGEQKPDRVPVIELMIDPEVLQAIKEIKEKYTWKGLPILT